ncbi:MAG TPA: prepilin-type N-terminal cleavage/methylation domain-containing protein [Tepidisphaeraceae bacterium]|nr:prepilin-type N-terminal cleavage/methylation domain-containing protein [Tepidisphaeraceae bacterium]
MRGRFQRLGQLRRRAGVTLVELLVVIGVVAIMMAIVVAALHKTIELVNSFR